MKKRMSFADMSPALLATKNAAVKLGVSEKVLLQVANELLAELLGCYVTKSKPAKKDLVLFWALCYAADIEIEDK